MKVAELGDNQDSGTKVVTVDHMYPEGCGFDPGAHIAIGTAIYTIVAVNRRLKQIEIAPMVAADPRDPEDAEPGEWSDPDA